MGQFKILLNNDIERGKWDACVSGSAAEVTYGLSDFLDQVHPNWSGLIMGNYEAVMPLPIKKKWGIQYLTQPHYTQQLGVFSSQPIQTEEILQFLSTKFKFFDIKLNTTNKLQNQNPSKLNVRWMDNYTLDLNVPFERLQGNFSPSHAKNMRRAVKNQIKLTHNIKPTDFIDFYLNNQPLNYNYSEEQKQTISNLTNQFGNKIMGVKSSNGDLLAAALIIESNVKRITYHSCSSNEGRQSKALFYLISELIKSNAEQDKILDFAGSSILSIADFFKGFGAQKETYPCVKMNLLPWPIRLFKK